MNENAPPTGKRAAGLSNRGGEVLPLPTRLYFADCNGRIKDGNATAGLRLAWTEGVGASHQQHGPAKCTDQ
jgi:hypothetical protein